MHLTKNFLLKKPDGTDPVKLQDFNDNAETLDAELALQQTAIDAANTHSKSAHVTGIKGSSETAYRTGQVNITKENIGLGNVPNVATNDQTPTYTEATVLSELTSGEKLSVALGKIKLAVKNVKTLLQQLGNTNISGVGNGTVTGALTAINSNLPYSSSNISCTDVTIPSSTTSQKIGEYVIPKTGFYSFFGRCGFVVTGGSLTSMVSFQAGAAIASVIPAQSGYYTYVPVSFSGYFITGRKIEFTALQVYCTTCKANYYFEVYGPE